MHRPGGNATDQIWRVHASSDRISSWTPLKPQHSIPCWLSVQWESNASRSCQSCQKRDHQKFVGGFALSGLLGSGRASKLPLGTLSLGLWVIAVDPAFIAGHQSIMNCIDQLNYLPAVMTTSFFLIFAEHPWDKLRTNLQHLQFLANNTHETLFILPINSDVLTSLLLPHLSSSLTDSLPFLNLLCHSKTDARFRQEDRKAVWSIPDVFCGIVSKFKIEFYWI